MSTEQDTTSPVLENRDSLADKQDFATADTDVFDPVAYINNSDWHTSRMGLDRIAELMHRLGNPQEALRVVHVAGTNGKGSTCAFVAHVLQCAGYRVGLFTSPYIVEFAERIRVNGENIVPDDLCRVTLAVREQAEAMADHPTEFELMTAVALVHFAQQQCDIVVLEVGLGGRFDSTNVVLAPEVCAITPIALDHTDLLGDTLAKIASEKAGIIKPGAMVVSAEQDEAALAVIRREANQKGCTFTMVDKSQLQGTPRSFSYRGYHNLGIGLLGSYQPENAALAIEIVEALRVRGFAVSDTALREGLAATHWPARFQVVAEQPTFIVDGGHNAQGARALVASLDQTFPGRKPVFLMGVLADKDYLTMLETVVPWAGAFVCIQPPNPRALAAPDLAEAIQRAVQNGAVDAGTMDVRMASSIAEGVALAQHMAGPDGVVCAFGSLYSVADVMAALDGANS